jgi:hypothetical protein
MEAVAAMDFRRQTEALNRCVVSCEEGVNPSIPLRLNERTVDPDWRSLVFRLQQWPSCRWLYSGGPSASPRRTTSRQPLGLEHARLDAVGKAGNLERGRTEQTLGDIVAQKRE